MCFNFTDPEFKALIAYEEDTGFSSLDGAAWETPNNNYLDDKGAVAGSLSLPTRGLKMYNGSQNPFFNIQLSAGFFASKKPNWDKATMGPQQVVVSEEGANLASIASSAAVSSLS